MREQINADRSAGATIGIPPEILGMPEGRKELNHPLAGRLIFEHTTFHVSNAPNLQLVLQLPVEEETEQKLQRLLASVCPHHCHNPGVKTKSFDMLCEASSLLSVVQIVGEES
jgi:hypothetical protein